MSLGVCLQMEVGVVVQLLRLGSSGINIAFMLDFLLVLILLYLGRYLLALPLVSWRF